MPLRVIRLSGFSSADTRGKIVVDTAIMTPQAIDRTARGCLCWSDVRFLDDAFGKSLVGDPNGIQYRKGLRMSAGRHLFSILTGKKIYPGPGQNPHRIIGSDKAPAVTVEGGMLFPNAYGLDANHSDYYSLASLQIDSHFGHFCGAQWQTSLKFNGPFSGSASALPADRFFASYSKMLNNNTTLCQQDKNDIFAYCVLQFWSIFCNGSTAPRAIGAGAGASIGGGRLTAFSATSLSGATFNFPVPVPALPSKFESSFRRVALDYALTAAGFAGFAAAFGISPSYGANTFPHIP